MSIESPPCSGSSSATLLDPHGASAAAAAREARGLLALRPYPGGRPAAAVEVQLFCK